MSGFCAASISGVLRYSWAGKDVELVRGSATLLKSLMNRR